MAGKRIYEIDVLRAFAIIIVLATHVRYYLDHGTIVYTFFDSINKYLDLGVLAGMGLFFFVSGYLLHHNHPKITGRRDILDFYKKRLLRIYPLYWAALIVSLFCFGFLNMYYFRSIDFGLGNMIAHFLGLQSLIPTIYLSYWFVGVILVYYALYPIIISMSKKTGDLSIIFLCITAILICIYAVFRNIDTRLYFYLMVFAAGIIARRIDIFEQGKIEKFIPALAVCLISAFVVDRLVFNGGMLAVHGFIANGISLLSLLATRSILMISFCLVLFWIVRKYGSLCWSEKLFLPQISYGSYAIFLIESFCFGTVYMVTQFFSIDGYLLDGIILIVAFPAILIIGYYIQKMENDFRQFLNHQTLNGPRRTSRA